MRLYKRILELTLLCGLFAGVLFADEGNPDGPQGVSSSSTSAKEQESARFARVEDKKAPSMDKVRWTEAKVSSDLNTEYDFGAGPLNEHYTDMRYAFTRRTMLAFLIHGGVEYQRLGFDGRKDLLLPGQLESVNAYLALDFRWSTKSLVRIQARPGMFGDFENLDAQEFNAPVDMAYTGIPSNRLQWALGMSIDPWRKYRVLPGGGVRYHASDRWELNFMLPTPQVEYKPNDTLTLVFGGDFRGDSYRLSRDFGTAHGNPSFNDALVDYSEIRIGPGFSWNVERLIELNMQAGVIAYRQFDYHNNNFTLTNAGAGAPFVTIQVHWLFKLKPPEKMGPAIESGRFQTPVIHNFFHFL